MLKQFVKVQWRFLDMNGKGKFCKNVALRSQSITQSIDLGGRKAIELASFQDNVALFKC